MNNNKGIFDCNFKKGFSYFQASFFVNSLHFVMNIRSYISVFGLHENVMQCYAMNTFRNPFTFSVGDWNWFLNQREIEGWKCIIVVIFKSSSCEKSRLTAYFSSSWLFILSSSFVSFNSLFRFCMSLSYWLSLAFFKKNYKCKLIFVLGDGQWKSSGNYLGIPAKLQKKIGNHVPYVLPVSPSYFVHLS